MENLIERVARHMDIDTRRAFNVTPRKLVIHPLNIHTPKQVGNATLVKLTGGAEIIYNSDSYIFSSRRDKTTFTYQRF